MSDNVFSKVHTIESLQALKAWNDGVSLPYTYLVIRTFSADESQINGVTVGYLPIGDALVVEEGGNILPSTVEGSRISFSPGPDKYVIVHWHFNLIGDEIDIEPSRPTSADGEPKRIERGGDE